MKDLDDLISGVKSTLDRAQKREAAFAAWYDKLTTSLPALGRDSVTITGENFRKAMRQAYRAGSDAANHRKDASE